MPPKFAFVFADGMGKPQGSDRILIRSHCMRDKNKRANSRRSRKNQSVEAEDARAMTKYQDAHTMTWYLTDVSYVPYYIWMDHVTQNLLYKFLMCDPVIDDASPQIERCVDFDVFETSALNPSMHDPLFAKAMTFIRSAIQDLALVSKKPSYLTYNHLSETLTLLHHDLAREAAHLKDTTLHVVVMLTLLSVIFRDWNAASAHMKGLMKIIDLRGGVEYLRVRPKMQYQIDRLTTAWTLSSGSQALSTPLTSFSWTPLCTLDPFSQYLCSHVTELRAILHPEVYTVFHDLQHIAKSVNINVDAQNKFHGRCFQKLVSLMQYRLQHLERKSKSHLEELICLGMLCVLTTAFKIPMRKIPYTHLQDRIRTMFEGPEIKVLVEQYSSAVFWVFMLGLVSVVDTDEGWVRESWKWFNHQWMGARKSLMEMIWVECLHDEPGRAAFTKLAGNQSE